MSLKRTLLRRLDERIRNVCECMWWRWWWRCVGTRRRVFSYTSGANVRLRTRTTNAVARHILVD
jgi:hypothetical protein